MKDPGPTLRTASNAPSLATALVLLLLGVPSSPGQQVPPGPAVSSQTAPAEVLLAEGLYHEQVLRDPAAAAEWYRRVIVDPSADARQHHTAQLRRARCLRLMNRPDQASALLREMLADPRLEVDLRETAQDEMRRVPAVEPARLMPEDTLLYVEVREPGRVLEQTVGLLDRSGLADKARQYVTGWMRRTFLRDLRGLFNDQFLLTESHKIEGVGLGLHNVGFETSDGRREFRADVLFVLYTGESAYRGVMNFVVQGLLQPDVLLDSVQFYVPGTAAPDFRVAFEAGLLVVCSDVRAGADAVLRHLGRQRGGTLYGSASFQQRPAGLSATDAVGVYVDWPKLIDLAISQAPEAQREDLDIIADTLSLRQIGPIFGTLALEADRAELELAANVLATDALLYRLVRTPPLEPAWRRWVPDDAILGIATGLTPGDRRWRDLERLLVELERVRSAAADPPTASAPAASDPLSGLRRFERAAQLSVADHVCRSINGIGLVLLDTQVRQSAEEAMPSLVLVLDVDQADAWRRRIERGIRLWLYDELSDAPLPITAIETPVGAVELLAIPRTRYGLAWQVQGRRVVLAFGVETLVEYLRRVTDAGPPAASRRGQTESKYAAVRIDELLRLYRLRAGPMAADIAPPVPAGGNAQPMIIRTYEHEGRIRVIIEQDELAAALDAVARALGKR